MTFLERFFDRVFVINLDKRGDRWEHALGELAKLGVKQFERFPGVEGMLDDAGRVNGNCGCTAAHRGLLEVISYHRWRRVLIFEDDFELIFGGAETQGRLEELEASISRGWDMLYLGGHYAEAPISRISPNIIRCGRMHTTSSFAITGEYAQRVAPYISGRGPIDSLFSGFAMEGRHWILQPRLFVQFSSFSDLTERDSTNAPCMMDVNHERMV